MHDWHRGKSTLKLMNKFMGTYHKSLALNLKNDHRSELQ